MTPSPLLITNGRVATPDGEMTWLLTDDGQIAAVGVGEPPRTESAERVDMGGGWVLPGFMDMHVHGSVGADTMDATPEALRRMARFFAAHGVTGFLATTVTAPDAATQSALENAAACLGPQPDGAAILGVHLEGPYINVKMKGAQAGEYVRLAHPDEYRRYLDLNVIREVTVAPEFPENHAFIRDCAARGIVVSIGHTAATYEDVVKAIDLGARQATHTFNAMTGVHHRQPGVAGAALTLDALKAEAITDTIHVHPVILNLIVRAKGRHGVIAITDAMSGAGMGDGQFDLGGQAVFVRGERATLADGTLAGSILTMDAGFRNLAAATGLSPADLAPIFSGNAAAQLGLTRKGHIAPGMDADLTLLTPALDVMGTLVGGRVVYRRG